MSLHSLILTHIKTFITDLILIQSNNTFQVLVGAPQWCPAFIADFESLNIISARQ